MTNKKQDVISAFFCQFNTAKNSYAQDQRIGYWGDTYKSERGFGIVDAGTIELRSNTKYKTVKTFFGLSSKCVEDGREYFLEVNVKTEKHTWKETIWQDKDSELFVEITDKMKELSEDAAKKETEKKNNALKSLIC